MELGLLYTYQKAKSLHQIQLDPNSKSKLE